MKTSAAHRQSTRFLMWVLIASALTFLLSTLVTMRILNRIMVAEVPDICGKSVETARASLKLKHLTMDISEFRFDAHVPLNQIISQDPKPGQTVKNGRLVRVVVSRGSQTVKVPELIGIPLQNASRLLDPKGILLGKISQVYSDTASKNRVMDQWPLGGEYITQGGRVHLLVSAGPRPATWVCPEVRGLDANQAVRIFKFLGLHLQSLKRQNNDHVPSGTVLRQTPVAGTRISSQETFSLLVSQGLDSPNSPGRYIRFHYRLPQGKDKTLMRLKIVLKDQSGVREVYNAMERPGMEINLPLTLHGEPGSVVIILNGQTLEERRL
jgi:eukaryotic-like serine/threonine-protein kinase